jgi:hypothetical protein
MIRSQHLGAIAERPQVVKHHEVKAEPAKTECQCCHQMLKIHGCDMCKTCHRYWIKHGTMRPAACIQRSLDKQNKAKWCKNCGSTSLYVEQRCKSCYRHWRLYNKERPRWRWDADICCAVCSFPKKAAKIQKRGRANFYKDKCLACYNYEKNLGRPRPEHLWGKGSKGWCDCGFPAEHQAGGFNLCNRCVKDYR